MTAKRRIVFSFFGLIALAGVGWTMRPQACDYGVDGGLNFGPWLGNVAARLTGSEEDCDPWSRIEAEPLDGPIALSFSINAIAGPATRHLLLSPDGTVEVWPEIWFLLADGPTSRDYSYSFNDPAIFELAKERLAPLQNWSHPSRLAELLELPPPPKSELECGHGRRHGGVEIFWSGDFELADAAGEVMADISYFEMSLGENCPAASTALGRFYELDRAIADRVPLNIYEGWFELENHLAEEFRQQNSQ